MIDLQYSRRFWQIAMLAGLLTIAQPARADDFETLVKAGNAALRAEQFQTAYDKLTQAFAIQKC